jgi:hypothetical protein
VRVLFTSLGFNLALLGLSANLAAVAAPLEMPRLDLTIGQQPTGGNPTAPTTNSQTVAGIGVEFLLPNRFRAGSPANKQLQTIVSNSAKKSPIAASFMTIFNNSTDYADAKAIAIDTSRPGDLEIVLVTNPAIPKDLTLETMQENFNRSKDMGSEFKPINTKIITTGTNKLLQIQGNLSIKGSTAKVLMGFLKQGDKTFQITYVYNSQNALQAAPVFEQIGSTFKVTTSTPAATLRK